MLQVEELETAYGPIRALDGVSFEVEQGSITAVLGANGAGKTSLLRTLSGLVRRARRAHPPRRDATSASCPSSGSSASAWPTCPRAAASSPS